MSDFRIVFNHKIVDYKILSFHSVFAHIELEKFLDSILSLSFTLSRRMSRPMNSANSASFISPRPLNRVISALLPNLAIAASLFHRYSNRTYLSLLRFPLSCGFSFGASHGILAADAEKRSLKNIYALSSQDRGRTYQEESDDQQAYVHSVDIGVGRDYDFVVSESSIPLRY